MARALPRSAAAEDSDSASSSPAPVIDEAAAIAAEHCRWARAAGLTPAMIFAALGVAPEGAVGWDDAIMLIGAAAPALVAG
jgi:hypothetical protein